MVFGGEGGGQGALVMPPERLLEYNVSAGWGPLCRFLGSPIPMAPFPGSRAHFLSQTVLLLVWALASKGRAQRKTRSINFLVSWRRIWTKICQNEALAIPYLFCQVFVGKIEGNIKKHVRIIFSRTNRKIRKVILEFFPTLQVGVVRF